MTNKDNGSILKYSDAQKEKVIIAREDYLQMKRRDSKTALGRTLLLNDRRFRHIFKGKKTIKIAFYSDVHFPYHNEAALFEFKRWVKNYKPDILIAGGDILDMYSISKYSKNPERKETLQDEFDLSAEHFKEMSKIVGDDCLKVFLIGNHEERMKKFLWDKAPQLSSLKALNLYDLMGLNANGFYHCDQEGFLLGDTVYKHGTKVRRIAGQSSVAEVNDYFYSVCMGHVHRTAKVRILKRGRSFFGVEAGGLMDPKAEYILNPDWHNGWVQAEYDVKSGQTHFEIHEYWD